MMNIFYLSECPIEAAEFHNDKHCVKMILEIAQLLSSAHHILDGPRDDIYKLTHKNHPCAVWARSTSDNYAWLYLHFCALLKVYEFRYLRKHATSRMIDVLRNPPKNIPRGNKFDPPKCMPDEFKVESTVESYRNYYRGGKSHLARWGGKSGEDETPDWVYERSI